MVLPLTVSCITPPDTCYENGNNVCPKVTKFGSWTCKTGEYNPLASLLLAQKEATIKG